MVPIYDFLLCETPSAWVKTALANLDMLLIDHAHCEKKAASSALAFMFRYPEHHDLLFELSGLAREELRHFDKVLRLMQAQGVRYRHLQPSRYATGLRSVASTTEPQRFVDLLMMAAFIEARSCERFYVLVPHLKGDMRRFYNGLLAAEARHFQLYLNYAQRVAKTDLQSRIRCFAEKEAELITKPDTEFRFHSGVIC